MHVHVVSDELADMSDFIDKYICIILYMLFSIFYCSEAFSCSKMRQWQELSRTKYLRYYALDTYYY